MQLRLAFLAIFLCSSVLLSAQDVEKTTTTKTSAIQKASRDFVMLQFTYEGWMKPDSVATTGFGRGFNGYICYDFPLGKSNFSFAAGLGIGTSNIYLSNQVLVLTDTGTNSQPRFTPEPADRDYKKFKLTTAYLEAPFELRFFGNKDNRNKGFKTALGVRVGTLIGAHTKGRRTVEGVKVIDKLNTKRYMENWRFSATARIGWGNFTLMGTYNLNNVFKVGVGPELTPYSIGLCISGL
jgi:hypothetical protein